MRKTRKYTVLLLLALLSCSPKVYPPSETVVNVRDSVVINFKDSTIFHHKTVNKDYTGLLDTLKIAGEHSAMTAFADTAHFIIKGELVEDPIKEKFVEKIVYKEHRDTCWKTEYKDKIVEKEVKYVPKVYKTSLWFSIAVILMAAAWLFLKIKKLDFLSIFKKK